MMEDSKRETIVFAYDTEEQRQQLLAMFPDWFNKKDGLRIVALSHDNEVSRVGLCQEANERYRDFYERSEAMEAIFEHPNLTRFKWSDIEESEDA